MFEADLWNVDSLSGALFFRFGHCFNIGVQRDGLQATVPSCNAIFALQKQSKVLLQKQSKVLLQKPGGCTCIHL